MDAKPRRQPNRREEAGQIPICMLEKDPKNMVATTCPVSGVNKIRDEIQRRGWNWICKQ